MEWSDSVIVPTSSLIPWWRLGTYFLAMETSFPKGTLLDMRDAS